MDSSSPHPLETCLGYSFLNPLLLAEALTHPSLAYETHRTHFDNQRLEFLGDAVLQLVLTHELYDQFEMFNEGNLTKLRARMVSRSALAIYARRLPLGEHLFLGKGEEMSGGRERASTLADAFEALIGAIYLDGGLEAVRKVLLTHCREDLKMLLAEPVEVNPKGQLQEFLQAFGFGSPNYAIIEDTGPDHQKAFVASVSWNKQLLATGSGPSKKIAEIAAAKAALESPVVMSLRHSTPSASAVNNSVNSLAKPL
jgi:ribonuclease III